MMHQVVPVNLCAGSGTQLWPLSRKLKSYYHERLAVFAAKQSEFNVFLYEVR
jgi:mannose-1-phosphate guanylyltransferase